MKAIFILATRCSLAALALSLLTVAPARAQWNPAVWTGLHGSVTSLETNYGVISQVWAAAVERINVGRPDPWFAPAGWDLELKNDAFAGYTNWTWTGTNATGFVVVITNEAVHTATITQTYYILHHPADFITNEPTWITQPMPYTWSGPGGSGTGTVSFNWIKPTLGLMDHVLLYYFSDDEDDWSAIHAYIDHDFVITNTFNDWFATVGGVTADQPTDFPRISANKLFDDLAVGWSSTWWTNEWGSYEDKSQRAVPEDVNRAVYFSRWRPHSNDWRIADVYFRTNRAWELDSLSTLWPRSDGDVVFLIGKIDTPGVRAEYINAVPGQTFTQDVSITVTVQGRYWHPITNQVDFIGETTAMEKRTGEETKHITPTNIAEFTNIWGYITNVAILPAYTTNSQMAATNSGFTTNTLLGDWIRIYAAEPQFWGRWPESATPVLDQDQGPTTLEMDDLLDRRTILRGLKWTPADAVQSTNTDSEQGTFQWEGYGWGEAATNVAWSDKSNSVLPYGVMHSANPPSFTTNMPGASWTNSATGAVTITGVSRAGWSYKAHVPPQSGNVRVFNAYTGAADLAYSVTAPGGTETGLIAGVASGTWGSAAFSFTETTPFITDESTPVALNWSASGGDSNAEVNTFSVDAMSAPDPWVEAYRGSGDIVPVIRSEILFESAIWLDAPALDADLYLAGVYPPAGGFPKISNFVWDTEGIAPLANLVTGECLYMVTESAASYTNIAITNTIKATPPFSGTLVNSKGWAILSGSSHLASELWAMKWVFLFPSAP